MEIIAKIVSAALLMLLGWQVLGSLWNIVAIVLELLRDR